MMELPAAKAKNRLKEHCNRTVLGPKRLVIDGIGYLPFGRDEAHVSSMWWPSATTEARWCRQAICRLQWESAFADDQSLTAAMLDRLLHHAHR
ncbi:ATP-binding protein [Variovorax brevis]